MTLRFTISLYNWFNYLNFCSTSISAGVAIKYKYEFFFHVTPLEFIFLNFLVKHIKSTSLQVVLESKRVDKHVKDNFMLLN